MYLYRSNVLGGEYMESNKIIEILNVLGYVIGVASVIAFITLFGDSLTIAISTLLGGVVLAVIMFAIADALDSLVKIVNNLVGINQTIIKIKEE